MALFSRTKKKETNPPAGGAAAATIERMPQISDVAHVLKSPRITEKATTAASMSVYVFDVAPNATKQQIKAAIERAYKVRPRKVRVVSIPVKRVRNMRTGQRGTKLGGKKAYVYLTKGETITLA